MGAGYGHSLRDGYSSRDDVSSRHGSVSLPQGDNFPWHLLTADTQTLISYFHALASTLSPPSSYLPLLLSLTSTLSPPSSIH